MLYYILIKQKKAAVITEGNLHVTYNLIKNPLFAGFGVLQEITKEKYRKDATPENAYIFGGFFSAIILRIL